MKWVTTSWTYSNLKKQNKKKQTKKNKKNIGLNTLIQSYIFFSVPLNRQDAQEGQHFRLLLPLRHPAVQGMHNI